MPSYGRPEALARMEQAPGGLPDAIIVLVNEDDPKLWQVDEDKLDDIEDERDS